MEDWCHSLAFLKESTTEKSPSDSRPDLRPSLAGFPLVLRPFQEPEMGEACLLASAPRGSLTLLSSK